METNLVDGLPEELLLAIASQLRVERGFVANAKAEDARRYENAVVVRSLHALTLTCRRFNAIATPLLYQCVIRTELLMTLLLRTLLQNPSLGRHVQYLEATSFAHQDPELYHVDFAGPTRDRFSEVIRSVAWIVPERGSPEDTALRAGAPFPSLETGRISMLTLERVQGQIRLSYFVVFVVLISLADNLQDIAVEGSMGNVVNLALRRWPKPGVLRRLWLLGEGLQSQAYSLRFISCIAQDGSSSLTHYLRSFFLPKTMWSEFGPPTALEKISLTVQDADEFFIDDHLQGCGSLKAFTCRWQQTEKRSALNPVDLPRLHQSLEQFQGSLTSLTIDTTESSWLINVRKETYVAALGSLRDFKALTHLDAAVVVLWGANDFWKPEPLSNLLPDSIESLIIRTERNACFRDVLRVLSMDYASSLPKLGMVDCIVSRAHTVEADLE